MKKPSPHFRNRLLRVLAAAVPVAVLIAGTVRNPFYWETAVQRGDRLVKAGKYTEAAKAYPDPWRAGIALYRGGEFEAAAKTFARVPGADGAFNAANAWLMHGQYDQAIAGYDRALGFHTGWQDALDNKALAIARRDRMKVSDKEREEESAGAYKPDQIVQDQKGGNQKPPDKPEEEGQPMDNATLQASWLRRVKTTPGDFLKAKFAWQAQHSATAETGAGAGAEAPQRKEGAP